MSDSQKLQTMTIILIIWIEIKVLFLFQTHKTFVYLQKTNEDIFDEIWKISDPP